MNPVPPVKILIIDDETIIRQSFSDHLEDLGYDAITANNGRVALEILENETPDLILTDLRMPEMGGLDVIRHVLKKNPDMPIVIISGAGRISDAIEALRLGAWDYILKPISEMSILEHLVKRVLDKKKLLQENRDYQENLQSMVREQTTELRQSKERTEGILNAVQSGVMVLDAKTHQIIEVNPAAAKIIEAKEDEIIGRICHDFICPAKKGECPISDKGENGDNAERILLTKSGERKDILKTVVKIKLDGQDSILESFIDITERVQAEKLLRESEIRYQAIIDVQADLLYRFSFDGEITFANKAFCQFFGIHANRVIGKNRFNYIPPEYHESVRNVTASLSAEEPVLIHENRNKSANGELYWFHWTNQAIINDNGEIIEYQSVGRDITERKKMERLQNLLYRISQAANRAHTPDNLYPVIHKIIQEVMPAKNFYIALYDEETNHIKPVYFIDEEDENPQLPLLSRGLTAYVLRTAEPLLCSIEKFNELLEQGEIVEAGSPSPIWLGVPLFVEGKTIGVMATQHYEDENAYGQEEKTTLEIISSSVSSAIARQIAQEETRSFAQINALLYQSSQQLSETLSLPLLYQRLYELISVSMDCDTFIISSYNKEEEMIYAQYIIHEGKEQDATVLPSIPLEPEGQGTQSQVIRKGTSLIIFDYMEHRKQIKTDYYVNNNGEVGDYDNKPQDEKSMQSVLATPLKLDGEVVGVIQVMSYKRNVYSQYHLSFLNALSSQISLSINNAKLFEQAQAEIKLRAQAEKELQSVNLALEERVEKRTNELSERIDMVNKLNLGMANLLEDLEIEKAIAEDNAENLKQANAELESFSHAVSHDLRAPLRHIESFTNLLDKNLEGNLDEKSQRYINHITTSTERMRNLIEDLLTLSRTSRVDLHIKALDMNGIIESVRANLLGEVHKREIVWRVAPLPLIQADSGLIKILWENLIGNAVKYTQTRKKAIIEIGILMSVEIPVFFIRDNGVGFAPEYKEQLFKVFERLHKSDDFEGSGVGLATVKRIVERHNGEIWADGEVGKGATFYFSLDNTDQ